MMQVNDCPSAMLLKAYATGTLDQSAHRLIDDHLDRCPTCQGELETLDDLPCTLFVGLRQPPQPAVHDPLLDELQARAKGLGRVSPEVTSISGDSTCTAGQFVERLAQSGLLAAAEIAALAARQAGLSPDRLL